MASPWCPHGVPMERPWWTQSTIVWPWCVDIVSMGGSEVRCCLHGATIVRPRWVSCIIVWPWRAHGISMVDPMPIVSTWRLDGVSMAPLWYIHGGCQTRFCVMHHGVAMRYLQATSTGRTRAHSRSHSHACIQYAGTAVYHVPTAVYKSTSSTAIT